MADRLASVGEHFSNRLALCSAVSCLKDNDPESARRCLNGIAGVLGDVSDTLAIVSDFSSAARLHPNIVGISDEAMEGAVRVMSDVVGLCASLSIACGDALPCGHGGTSDDD